MMGEWHKFMDGWSNVSSVYADDLPSVDFIHLHEITLHRDGPRATLRFDIDQLPLSMPAKWAQRGVNRVQLQLMLSGVRSIQLSGLHRSMSLRLSMRKEGELVHLEARQTDMSLDIVADFVTLVGISGYCAHPNP